MVKKAGQRGRNERRGDAYSLPYVEPPSDARTKLADFFNILLDRSARCITAAHYRRIQAKSLVSNAFLPCVKVVLRQAFATFLTTSPWVG